MGANGGSGSGGWAGPALVVDDQERGLFLVHRSVFTDTGILAMERERIFDRCWLYAGHESEIPKAGDFVTRRVAGRPVIVTRGRDGKVRALLNTCTHRGALVRREARRNAKTHQCFYHGWSFTPEGEVNGIPGEDAYSEAFDRGERRLREPPGGTASYRDFIFVNFNPENEVSLEDYLWDAKEYLGCIADQSAGRMEVLQGSQPFGMRCNHKLHVENSTDGYHALVAHKRYFDWLAGAGAMDVSAGLRFSPKALGNGHAIIGRSVAPFGRPMAQWIPYFGEERKPHFEEMYRKAVERLGEERAHQVCTCGGILFIFPNLIINDIISTTVRTFYPIEPGYMEVTAWCLGPEEEEAPERAVRLDGFVTFNSPGGFVNPDDTEALESCQRGFEAAKEVEYSDVSRGMKRLLQGGEDELEMRVFWRQWARLMREAGPASTHTGTDA